MITGSIEKNKSTHLLFRAERSRKPSDWWRGRSSLDEALGLSSSSRSNEPPIFLSVEGQIAAQIAPLPHGNGLGHLPVLPGQLVLPQQLGPEI